MLIFFNLCVINCYTIFSFSYVIEYNYSVNFTRRGIESQTRFYAKHQDNKAYCGLCSENEKCKIGH